MRPTLILVLILALPVATWASLSVSVTDPPLEGARLTTDERFARIDSLEALYDHTDGVERAALAHRIAQLYLSTDLAKHRRLALQYLDESVYAKHDGAFDAGRLRARTAQKMRYTRDARSWFEELTAIHPEDPRSHVQLGRFHFGEAKRILDQKRFSTARMAYTAAVQADTTHAPAWYGLAASLIALENFGPALMASRKLLEWERTRRAAWMMMGASHVGRREFDEAQRAFDRALALSSPAVRAVFEHGRGFVSPQHLASAVKFGIDPSRLNRIMQEHQPGFGYGDEVDVELVLADQAVREQALDIYWQTQDTWPSSLVNRRRLEYWKRLVEADVLFGDPDAARRGWTTEMGRAIVRWGRPDFMIYEPPSSAVDLEDWRYRGVRLPPSTYIPSQEQLWVWTYRSPAAWFSLLFTDATYNSRWRAEGTTVQTMLARAKAQPMLFFDDSANAQFDLFVDNATFARGPERRVEFYASMRLVDRFGNPVDMDDREPLLVEWAIYDDAEERIDYRRQELTSDRLRSNLTESLGQIWSGDDADELLTQLAARLEPGHYRLAIDVSSPSRGHRGAQIYLNVPTSPPPGLLELSDLVLATEFVPFDPEQDIPSDFVKYAFGILPTPAGQFSSTDQTAYVYFEAYNLDQDATRRTHFNVSYQIYRVPRGVDVALKGAELDLSDLEKMDPVGLTFVEERTGLAPEGHVVKGGEVEIGDLRPGRYVLLVEVEDLLGEA
ncbi:MAG: GWxTD domain-containing protein, partial [Gemmatimonadetes bacterium]|nr:GWxTD domain-containing protein [Gemmatimonadota bacterium]